MKTLAVFGASGRTGHCLISAATEAGIAVRASVRRKESIPETPAVKAIVGSILNNEHVHEVLEEADAACLVFGPHPPFTDVFCAESTEIIISEMKRAGVSRLVCQTGAMIGDYVKNRSWLFEKMAALYRRRNVEAYRDRLTQEELVKNSGLDWLVVKPPRLQDQQTSALPSVGPDVRVGMMSSVSRIQIANFIVGQILRPTIINRIVFIKA